MCLICKHLHSSCMCKLYNLLEIRTDSIVGWIIDKNCLRIWICIHHTFYFRNFYPKCNPNSWVYLCLYIYWNRSHSARSRISRSRMWSYSTFIQ